jgi:acetate kinase
VPGTVLVLNAGSSSLKFAVYRPETPRDGLHLLLRGELESIGTRPRFHATDGAGAPVADAFFEETKVTDPASAASFVDEWLDGQLSGFRPEAVGHRVVHGGPRFREPVRVDEGILAFLETLIPLAPLHQPQDLAVIEAIARRRPGLPQVACFDTAFHRKHAKVAQLFGLPLSFYDEGVMRYGFHGLSYEYIALSLPDVAPRIADGRVVVAHLGAGASLCAMKARQSVDSTMGFTTLDGVAMSTRPGTIDPGVLLYLLQSKGYDAVKLQHLLYKESGLLGLSGISGNMRDLLASDESAARDAIDYFVFRIVKEIGALTCVLGGLDGLVFTAGIGEHAALIRDKVCVGLSWLGLRLDPAANGRNGPRISGPASRVGAYVIPTDEEKMIAQHTLETLRVESG